MRAHEFILLEYNRDITAKNYGANLVARGEGNDVAEILATLESGDPTPNKQYTQWIVRKYIQGDFLLEDITIVKQYLEKFIEASRKRLIDIRDLNRYKTLGDLKKTINSIYRSDSNTTQSGVYPVLPDTKIYYNGPEGQFVTPLTLKSSMDLQKIGEVTEWCTADSRAPTYYPRYTKEGPLYIWIDKSGKKYQFHFESRQFNNADDTTISNEKLEYFFLDFEITSKILKPIAEKYYRKLIYYHPTVVTNLNRYIPNRFLTPELVNLIISERPQYLEHIPVHLRTYDLCFESVKNTGWTLEFVPHKFKTPEICLVAVKVYGRALRYVPNEIKSMEICVEAVNRDSWAYDYVPDNLKTYSFYVKIVRHDPDSIKLVPEKFKTYELCLLAVKLRSSAIEYVPVKYHDKIKQELGL